MRKTIAICLLMAGSVSDLGAAKDKTFPTIGPTDLEKAGFKKLEFKKLSEEEAAAFYEVYPPDSEMLERVRLGPITKSSMGVCIAGEAPPLKEAVKKFPSYYPMVGRMKQVTGTLEWRGKILIFATKTQEYRIAEYFILHRFEEMGFGPKAKAREATLDAVWAVSKLYGLIFYYVERVELK